MSRPLASTAAAWSSRSRWYPQPDGPAFSSFNATRPRVVNRTFEYGPTHIQRSSKQACQFRSFSGTAAKRLVDGRNRISQFWIPTAKINPPKSNDEKEIAFALLQKAGLVYKAHSGLFHLLPLGLRIQEKLEKLIDKHMRSLGASKLSLSSITTQALWKQSGRIGDDLKPGQHEFLTVNDRKKSGLLLGPTHEEEITALAANFVKSYRDLPLRLYQISRKYRDELRPRQGLLRAKEFLMKDMYTFDSTKEAALETYRDVCDAYRNLLDEVGLPYVVAEADSGNMGGKLSHEYHFVSPFGEDTVYECSSCGYTANEEVVEKREPDRASTDKETQYTTWIGFTQDQKTLVRVYVPESAGSDAIDIRAVQDIVPSLDTSRQLVDGASTEGISPGIDSINLIDYRLHGMQPKDDLSEGVHSVTTHPTTSKPLDLLKITDQSPCPRCSDGELTEHRCIEVGHTFHLGTRYSQPLEATVAARPSSDGRQSKVPMEMGCHGIGVSRLMGAIAAISVESTAGKGMNWPANIAPFQVVIIAHDDYKLDAEKIYDELTTLSTPVDAVVDDRDKPFAWKLGDAELIGYPLTLVLGKKYGQQGMIELQRRTGTKLPLIAKEDLTKTCSELLYSQ